MVCTVCCAVVSLRRVVSCCVVVVVFGVVVVVVCCVSVRVIGEILGLFEKRTTAKAFANDVFIDQDRRRPTTLRYL